MTDDDRTPPAPGPTDDVPPPRGTRGTLSRRHRLRILQVVAVAHLVLAVVTASAVTVAYRSLDSNIETGERIEHVVERPEPRPVAAARELEPQPEPMNVLVMGSDTRVGEGNKIDGESGEGGSDTAILLHVSADRETAYGVSLPRDAMVARPACEGPDGSTVPAQDPVMFNTAFAVGGPRCTALTVESLTGVYVDHYLVLDFNGFQGMVDAVHGVEVCIPREVADPRHGIFFSAGVQTLTGRQALNYVRERYVLSVTGDIGRMKRQQAFIASMVNKVISAGTLSRPTRVYRFLDAATKSIVVDQDLDSVSELVDLAMQFQDTGLDRISFVTVPYEEYQPDPNRLVWAPEAQKLWKRIRKDRPLGDRLGQNRVSAADSVGTLDGSPAAGSTGPAGKQSPRGTGSRRGGAKGKSARAPRTAEQQAAREAAGLCA